ncbi:CLUMA_CG019872, isoform A [Clunio marinus]|uniref:CLUMA_CG019872, isoform A n=1 Tax=Clunio marinus TaxID=568069 RepID=A0A1J1J2R6_9DIPT|nr:CLUMA_CG019872, isoform A [Clunio marinus]
MKSFILTAFTATHHNYSDIKPIWRVLNIALLNGSKELKAEKRQEIHELYFGVKRTFLLSNQIAINQCDDVKKCNKL